MKYEDTAIKDDEVPVASSRVFQHIVKTYASEVNKLNSVWHQFAEDDLAFKPHPRSSSVKDVIEHELLSERRFFGEFLGLPEVPANEVLPQERTPQAFAARMGIFWRRVLRPTNHRGHLGAYLRLLKKTVPSIYGPTADVRWEGAHPTSSVAAANRK